MRKTISEQPGKIIPNGVKPEPHEMDTFLLFANLGKTVELIPTSHTPKDKRADCIIDGVEWEVKSPTINKKRALERVFYAANSQSANLIIDLRRLRGDTALAILLLEKCFKHARKARRMYIIDDSNNIPQFYKK